MFLLGIYTYSHIGVYYSYILLGVKWCILGMYNLGVYGMVYKFRWTNFPIVWVLILLDVLKNIAERKSSFQKKKLCRVSIASFRCSRFFEEIHLFRGLFIHDHTRFFGSPF